jgi:peptidoglycan/xylan/chitin deacetylase (PgdA/CDA1 family)
MFMRLSSSRRTSALLALAGAFAFVPGQQVSEPAAAATRTVVSLTFDDGHASHFSTLPMLASHGMTGTYYINSAMVGTSAYYMMWWQIHALADAGNEIGGHTLHHVNLTEVGFLSAQWEVCRDRQNLLDRGFAPASFAYPEAGVDANAERIVRQCGYASGRSAGNVFSDGACDGCPDAETIPPADRYALDTPEPAVVSTTLVEMKRYVTEAENNGGGWVILNFHGICDNLCTADNSVRRATFTAFLDWLELRSDRGTVVRTVGSVMGVPTTPVEPVKPESEPDHHGCSEAILGWRMPGG